MKLPALAVAAFTVAAFIGGTAAAQMAPAATMQPIPNPPESSKSMAHHGKTHHHMHVHHHVHVHHHMKAAPKADTAAPAPAAPATPQ
jgi:hypothetical protein